MTPILRQLADALVEATPEWWTEATMRVEVQPSPEGVEINHSVWSVEHERDVAVATDVITAATRDRQLLCETAGQPWSALVFQIEENAEGWKFETKFEYE